MVIPEPLVVVILQNNKKDITTCYLNCKPQSRIYQGNVGSLSVNSSFLGFTELVIPVTTCLIAVCDFISLMIIVLFFCFVFSSFQQRLSYNTLSDLALALIDGTVYEIVQGLLDIQHLTEKNLYNQRQKLHCEHQGLCSAYLETCKYLLSKTSLQRNEQV